MSRISLTCGTANTRGVHVAGRVHGRQGEAASRCGPEHGMRWAGSWGVILSGRGVREHMESEKEPVAFVELGEGAGSHSGSHHVGSLRCRSSPYSVVARRRENLHELTSGDTQGGFWQ